MFDLDFKIVLYLALKAVIEQGLVLGVYEDLKHEENFELTPAAEKFNKRSKGRLKEILRMWAVVLESYSRQV